MVLKESNCDESKLCETSFNTVQLCVIILKKIISFLSENSNLESFINLILIIPSQTSLYIFFP